MIFNLQPRNTFGKESYAFWEDFLTKEELNFLENCKEWEGASPAFIGGDGNKTMNPNVRDSSVLWLYPNEQNKIIWEKISSVVAEVNRRFFHFDLTGFFEPMQLGSYDAKNSGHYTWHIDGGAKQISVPRKLSMALLLTDTALFSGGDLEIKTDNDKPITLNQKRGRAWFFPSYVIHRVSPVTSGTRKSAVLWVGGPDFK